MQTKDTQENFAVFSKIFRRGKKLILSCVLALILPIIIYNEITSPIYEAGTTLVFEEFTNSVASYDYDLSREVFFTNQMEEIKSHSFALDILESLPSGIIKRFPLPETEPGFDTTEYIVTEIQENISTYPIRNSNIVRISFQASVPLLSKMVANTAADVLQIRNYQIKKEGVSGVRVFIDSQLKRYAEQLETAELVLKEFKEQNKVTSVDQESKEILRRITEAEVLYNTVKTERRSREERLAALQKRLVAQKKILGLSITDIGSPWAEKLKEKLIDLNLQFMNFQVQGYQSSHPKMVDLKQKIDKVKEELTENTLKLIQGQNFTDPIGQVGKYVDETLNLQIELETLKASEAALKDVIRGYDIKMSSFPDKEFMLAKLVRERDVNQKIYMALLEKGEEAKIAEVEQVKNIRVIDKAKLPDLAVSPRKKLNLAIGILLGFLLGVGIAFIAELKNNTIQTPYEVENITDWPVIAVIPNINGITNGNLNQIKNLNHRDSQNGSVKRALISSLAPATGAAECYRMLRTNLQFLGIGEKYKTLLVTSIGPGDGKSTLLSNLALTFAALNDNVLIVDSDLHIPSIHSFFGLDRENGLTDLLGGLNDLERKVSANSHTTQEKGRDTLGQNIFRATINDSYVEKNLNILTSGTKLSNPNNSCFNKMIPILFEEFKRKFNLVIIDSAPLLLVTDTLVLASSVDAVLLIVHPNKYDEEMLLKAKTLLLNANANVIGTVVNNMELDRRYKKYYGRSSS